jgi:dihydroneopterin triphosphate diphosphatase
VEVKRNKLLRAPIQVLVLPYKISNDTVEYCVFRRSDARYWQFIAGGGEDKETPLEAAQREAHEEAALEKTLCWHPLTSAFYVPANCISTQQRQHWPHDIFVLPEYCFAVNAENATIKISAEHTEFIWASFEKANELLHWETNKTALFELDHRIRQNLWGSTQSKNDKP